jgi:hypothetical protein
MTLSEMIGSRLKRKENCHPHLPADSFCVPSRLFCQAFNQEVKRSPPSRELRDLVCYHAHRAVPGVVWLFANEYPWQEEGNGQSWLQRELSIAIVRGTFPVADISIFTPPEKQNEADPKIRFISHLPESSEREQIEKSVYILENSGPLETWRITGWMYHLAAVLENGQNSLLI